MVLCRNRAGWPVYVLVHAAVLAVNSLGLLGLSGLRVQGGLRVGLRKFSFNCWVCRVHIELWGDCLPAVA
jgi:hypothetical protein